jgi:hypothetical protein
MALREVLHVPDHQTLRLLPKVVHSSEYQL